MDKPQIELVVEVPLTEEILYDYWKQERQPNLNELGNRIQKCVREWLDGQ